MDISLRLYNTISRTKELFRPRTNNTVSLYTCGPTVYNYAHIGNLRTYIFEDVLKRVLIANGYRVQHVMNITDVGHLTDDQDQGEDKMELSARREQRSVWDVAAHYTKAFQEDLLCLNILPPSIWCKATDHIAEQIALIQKLEQKGFTYTIDDGVYFDTSKFSRYGELARLNVKGLKAGARVEVVRGKRHPTDFALWKLSAPQGAHPEPNEGFSDDALRRRQMEWPSPWGVGFPGWHIECSAMSMKYLRLPIDIHCGGIDHIPVHHTNEIAQSEAATGTRPFVRVWMHGEFMTIRTGKMAKSQGNFITLANLMEEGFDPLAFRLFTYSAHYRTTMDFTFKALNAAQQSYEHLSNSLRERLQEQLTDSTATGTSTTKALPANLRRFEQRFLSAINDDLNMPEAMAVVWATVKAKIPNNDVARLIRWYDSVLALNLLGSESASIISEEIDALVRQRSQARAQKDWKKSDQLRKTIEDGGYAVEDTLSGTRVAKRKRFP